MKPIYISREIYTLADPEAVRHLTMYSNGDNIFIFTNHITRPRYGTWSVWDFADESRAQGPALTPNDSLTFESVTDHRSQELLAILNREQCRIAVLWSGGIDSTVILSSLIRNWSPADLQQIDVVMNQNSYVENPVFYDQAIKQHGLNVISIADLYQNPIENHIITDGDPADKLGPGSIALSYAKNHRLTVPWQTAQNNLVEFFAHKFDNKQQCQQYFELIGENIQQTGAPVENTGDWFWWINYNWQWAGTMWQMYTMLERKDTEQLGLYQRRYHAWFDSDLYQQWSFGSEGRGCRNIDNIRQYKWPAKLYINGVVDNPWFLEYKTKRYSQGRYLGSNTLSRQSIRLVKPWAIFEDGSVLDHQDPIKIQQFIDRYLLI